MEIQSTVGRPVWDGIGHAIEEGRRFTAADDMVSALGLDWTVRTEPFISARTGVQAGQMREVIRNDNGQHMGIVKGRYHVIQNVDAFGFLPQVCGQYGMKIVNGGSTGEGERIWVLVKVGEQVFQQRFLSNGEKDQIDHHLLFWNSFDGSTSCRIAAIPHAIHCANALAATWGGTEEDHKWAIRHTRSAPDRLAEAQKQIPLALGWMADFSEGLVALEEERFNTVQMRAYAEQVIVDVRGVLDENRELGKRADGTPKTDRSKASRERAVDKMVDLFEGEGVTCRGVTKLDAYQAVTEYVDHHRRRATHAGNVQRAAAARFEETIFGQNSNKFRRAALTRLRG